MSRFSSFLGVLMMVVALREPLLNGLVYSELSLTSVIMLLFNLKLKLCYSDIT